MNIFLAEAKEITLTQGRLHGSFYCRINISHVTSCDKRFLASPKDQLDIHCWTIGPGKDVYIPTTTLYSMTILY